MQVLQTCSIRASRYSDRDGHVIRGIRKPVRMQDLPHRILLLAVRFGKAELGIVAVTNLVPVRDFSNSGTTYVET